MTKKYTSIKLDDLAKELNVSKVTISKALRGHPDISAETTRKVKELAEKMGYIPNIFAKSLSAKNTNTIGLIVPKIAHIFFSSVIEAVYDEAFKNNYEVVLTVSQEKEERERNHVLSLISMKVDGIIISVTEQTKDYSVFLRAMEQDVPLLFIDRIPDLPNISSITCDDKNGAYNAVEFGIKKGYKRIGHIGGYQHISIGRERYNGFVEAMEKHNMPLNKQWITQGGFGEEDGCMAFNRMYNSGTLPEYVLAVTYPVALGFYTAAIDAGLSVPGDIEITCFGNSTFSRQIESAFNFIHQPTVELGREAVRLMIERLKNPKEYEPKNIELKTQLILHNDAKKAVCK